MIDQVIILPVGSVEYHGSILPEITDSIIAENVASSVSGRISNATLLPILHYGVSTEHSGFRETVTVHNEVYFRYITDLLDSIAKTNDALIVILNGHGGNTNILGAVESEFNHSHNNSKVFAPPLYPMPVRELSKELLGEFDTHAGSMESSLIAFYLDKEDQEIIDDDFVKQMSSSLRFFMSNKVNPKGVIKNTNKLIVNPQFGKELHESIVQLIVDDVHKLLKDINRVRSNER